MQLALFARFHSALCFAHRREREKNNRRSELDFLLFLLLLCPVKFLPPAQKFYQGIPIPTPPRNRFRLPATLSTLVVGANLRFDRRFIQCRLRFASPR